MAMNDVFNSDAFSLQSLTAAINEQPYQPGRLGELGLFTESGITTTNVVVESEQGALAMVSNKPRGGVRQVVDADKRKARSFIVPHLPTTATIMADEVTNIRAFGTETDLQAVERVRDMRLAKMRRYLDVTLEYHRIGAVKGTILDADGSTVIYNLFTEFGISQQTLGMALTTGTTNVLNKIVQAKRLSEGELGAVMVTRYRALCGAGFFDALTSHAKVETAYDRWQEGEFLRSDVRAGFSLGGVIWEEYRGSVGGVAFVGTDDAYLIPEGVPDLFITNFAPADYMETVNTVGLPMYAKSEPLPMNKGVELEAQSNPLCICTRPRAVIKLTKV